MKIQKWMSLKNEFCTWFLWNFYMFLDFFIYKLLSWSKTEARHVFFSSSIQFYVAMAFSRWKRSFDWESKDILFVDEKKTSQIWSHLLNFQTKTKETNAREFHTRNNFEIMIIMSSHIVPHFRLFTRYVCNHLCLCRGEVTFLTG